MALAHVASPYTGVYFSIERMLSTVSGIDGENELAHHMPYYWAQVPYHAVPCHFGWHLRGTRTVGTALARSASLCVTRDKRPISATSTAPVTRDGRMVQ